MWTAGFDTTTWTLLIIAALIGTAAGAISGLVGIGGGIVIIPLLSMLLQFDQHTAQGTALLVFSLPILIPAALNYRKEGRLDIPIALAIAVGILSTGYFVGQWAQGLDKVLLRRIFSVFLILMGGYLFWRAGRSLPAVAPGDRTLTQRLLSGFFIGALTGALNGLTGLGGGIIIVPLLVFLSRMDQHTAQGTSLFAVTMPVTFVAAYPYLKQGNAHIPAALAVAVGLTLGSYGSSIFAQRIPRKTLTRIFASVVVLTGIYKVLETPQKDTPRSGTSAPTPTIPRSDLSSAPSMRAAPSDTQGRSSPSHGVGNP